jgi:hypothetical protein
MAWPPTDRRAAEPAEPAPERRPQQPWHKRIPTVVQYASGVVGLATATLGLVFLVWPNVKPQQSPAALASPLELRLENPVTFRQYLLLEGLPADGASSSQLEKLGALVRVEAKPTGFRGRRLPLRWLLIEENGGPVAQEKALDLEPEADVSLYHRIWVEPPAPGRYFLRVQVFPPGADTSPSMRPLDDEDTDVFPWPPPAR